FAGAIATASLFPALAVDTQSYLLTKGQHFIQTNSAAPALAPTDQKPFEFYSMVEPTSPGSVTNAILRLPSKKDRGMSNFLDGFEFNRSFATKSQLYAAFPSGHCRSVIDTASEGRKTTPPELPAQVSPPVPRVLNFDDLQEIEADHELGLSW